MDDFIEGEYTSKHTNTQTNKQQDERTEMEMSELWLRKDMVPFSRLV
jgi:hypothetical protein